MKDITPDVLQALADGSTESVNLMEWLATDMSLLLHKVSGIIGHKSLRDNLLDARGRIQGKGITQRLKIIGDAIALALPDLDHEDFLVLAEHKSDLVRQWACYAANSDERRSDLRTRLSETLIFASDRNMSVRETAWMAFRPHLIRDLHGGLACLGALSSDNNSNIRRFAVEVTRPRSVWGSHILQLKHDPALAEDILERTRADPERYVQLAVGNWLNDASKSRPDWVRALCERWRTLNDRNTNYIIRRGLRTLSRLEEGRDGQLVLR